MFITTQIEMNFMKWRTTVLNCYLKSVVKCLTAPQPQQQQATAAAALYE